MPRAGLTPDIVTGAAAALVDDEGLGALTLARVASRLGVRPPSLYNHVDGRDGLERLIALRGVEELAESCRSAVMGRSGNEALAAMAAAYRAYAVSRPGVYALTQRARPGDTGYEHRAERLLEAVTALLEGFGLTGDDVIHAARAVRAALHGFATLETHEGFGLEVDIDASFRWLVSMLQRGIGA